MRAAEKGGERWKEMEGETREVRREGGRERESRRERGKERERDRESHPSHRSQVYGVH